MKTKETILENGLSLLSSCNESLHSVMFSFSFHGGSIYETSKNMGITHLLEHLFFRNFGGIRQSEYYSKLETLGVGARGATYLNYVTFSFRVSSQHFLKTFDLAMNLFNQYEWTHEEIRNEKAVVINQIRYQSDHSFDKHLEKTYLRGTNVERPIMGTVASVNKLTRKEILTWKEQVIQPSNCICILTGNYTDGDLQYVAQKLERVENHSEFTKKQLLRKPEDFCMRDKQSDIIQDMKWEEADVIISFDMDCHEIPIQPARLLLSILGEGMGSKLSLSLREENSYTNEVITDLNYYLDFSRIVFTYLVDFNNLKSSLLEFFKCIRDLKSKITEDDINSSISFYTINAEWDYDNVETMEYCIQRAKINQNEIYSLQDDIKKYESVSIQTLYEVSNKLLSSDNLMISVVNNKEELPERELKHVIHECREMLK